VFQGSCLCTCSEACACSALTSTFYEGHVKAIKRQTAWYAGAGPLAPRGPRFYKYPNSRARRH